MRFIHIDTAKSNGKIMTDFVLFCFFFTAQYNTFVSNFRYETRQAMLLGGNCPAIQRFPNKS
jgi:hypothetical protein